MAVTMNTKLVSTYVCAFVLFCFAEPALGSDESLAIIDSIFNERQCAHQGGICVIESHCPYGHMTAIKGLCPKQQHKEVECCYAISVHETRCTKNGGDCMIEGTCNPKIILDHVTDCAKGRVCCKLLY